MVQTSTGEKQTRFVSADSHVNEPPEAWERVQKQYGDRAPKVVWNPSPNELGPYLEIEAAAGSLEGSNRESCAMEFRGLYSGGLAHDPNEDRNSERISNFKRNFRFEDWRGPWDPDQRLKDMENDSVDAEIIYASHLRHFYDLSETDEPLLRAIAISYNEWLMDFCSYAPKKLFGLPVLSVLNPQTAVEDLQAYAKRGVKGFMIGASVPSGMSYGSPDFDPLWAAAEEAGLPMHLHISTAKWRRPSFKSGLRSVHTEIQDSLSEMIFSGVFDRFPKLRIVSAEFGIGWVAYWHAQLHDFPGGQAKHLKRRPVEYAQDNVWYTFQDDRAGLLTTSLFGADRFLWASDYPHQDCTWPDSKTIIDRQFEGIPDDVRHKITRQNSIDLYDLEV